MRDRAVEACDLEQVGLLALYGIEHEPERVIRMRVRSAMWDSIPRRRSPYVTVSGGEWIADAEPANTPDPDAVVDAHRVVAASRGRVLQIVLLTAQGVGPTEIGRELGISTTAATAALRRAWVAAESGRVAGLGRTGRPKTACSR